MRGAGRPAVLGGELLIVGRCARGNVSGPVIQVTVPLARRPVTFSICGPRAATSSGRRVPTARRSCRGRVTVSPAARGVVAPQQRPERLEVLPHPPRTGLSNGSPHMPSTTIWWDSPMPRSRRPLLTWLTVSAWPASIITWRGWIGTTPLSRSGSRGRPGPRRRWP